MREQAERKSLWPITVHQDEKEQLCVNDAQVNGAGHTLNRADVRVAESGTTSCGVCSDLLNQLQITKTDLARLTAEREALTKTVSCTGSDTQTEAAIPSLAHSAFLGAKPILVSPWDTVGLSNVHLALLAEIKAREAAELERDQARDALRVLLNMVSRGELNPPTLAQHSKDCKCVICDARAILALKLQPSGPSAPEGEKAHDKN